MTVDFKEGFTINFNKTSDGKNEITFTNHGKDWGFIPNVTKDFGNYWYKYSVKASRAGHHGKDVCDMIYFDSAAFDNDFDFYSDMHKDVFGVRPHFTSEKWEEIVKRAQNRKP